MSWRGLCISSPARLDLRAGRLLLRREGEEDVALPLEDLGFVVIDTPQARLSAALLSACAEQGCLLLTVDARHMPCAAVLPLAPYYRQLGGAGRSTQKTAVAGLRTGQDRQSGGLPAPAGP